MADAPETLSNSLAFLQMDLFDPDFTDTRSRTRAGASAVQAMMGGSLLQWAIDREGKAEDRLIEDLGALLNSRNSASHHRIRHPRRRVRRS